MLKSDKKYHGIVSDQTRRKVGKAVDYLLFMANDKYLPGTTHGKSYKFKLAFVTLTLPSVQRHSDNEIKELCLNQLLIEFRKVYKVRNYIWRAEKQRNGNIHFHILVDKFIPWNELRNRWNRIIEKLGYVSGYRDEMRRFHSEGFKLRKDLLQHWDYQSQIKAYQKGKVNDWASPNSTDVHSLYKVMNVKDYICKYCTKNETNSEVSGRIWGCNEELSNIKGAQIVIDESLKSELDDIVQHMKPRVYKGDYFSVIHVNVNSITGKSGLQIRQAFMQYLLETFNYNYQQLLDNT